jgi:hypothetical protein
MSGSGRLGMGGGRPVLRIDFADFWPGFDKTHNFFHDLLAKRYEVRITRHPDLVIYSRYGKDHRAYGCRRLMVNWENRPWSFSECDFAITSDHVDHPDHFRFPLFAVAVPDDGPPSIDDPAAVLASKTGFASIVVSNPRGATRNAMLDLMNGYREVASGGRYRNNVGGPVADKFAFQRRYKFSLAFENSSYPGYTTEKVVHALEADTVPIYWGNPLVHRDLNADRFLSFHDHGSLEALMDRVVEIDQDDAAYCEMLAQPWFLDGVTPDCARRDLLLDWIGRAVDDDRVPVARRRHRPRVMARRTIDRWRARRRIRSRIT